MFWINVDKGLSFDSLDPSERGESIVKVGIDTLDGFSTGFSAEGIADNRFDTSPKGTSSPIPSPLSSNSLLLDEVSLSVSLVSLALLVSADVAEEGDEDEELTDSKLFFLLLTGLVSEGVRFEELDLLHVMVGIANGFVALLGTIILLRFLCRPCDMMDCN